MANTYVKNTTTFFENVLTGWDPNNIMSRQVEHYSPNMKDMERSGLIVNRPMPYVSTVTTGRDVTGQYGGMTDLTVPTSLAESNIINVTFTMNALELNDPIRRKRKARSAVQALSAKVDRIIANEIAMKGSLVVTDSAALTSYEQAAVCEAVMQEQDIQIEQDRSMIFNPRDGATFSGAIAGRETMNKEQLSAYERSALLPVAGFDSFRSGFLPTINAATATSKTVNGAQSHVPITASNNLPADNRYMTLTVNSSADIAIGDAFTIAGVNALSHIHKQDTGQLKTFRIVSITNGTNVVITPAIVVGGGSEVETQHANCTAGAADGAAISFVNTTTKTSNLFFMRDSVELIHGSLAADELGSNIDIMRETTDSGIEIIFAKQGNIDDLTAKYRLTMWVNANVLNTEMCGILLANQT